MPIAGSPRAERINAEVAVRRLRDDELRDLGPAETLHGRGRGDEVRRDVELELLRAPRVDDELLVVPVGFHGLRVVPYER